jgi:hypothetical protein
VILRAHGWIKSCMIDTKTKIWIDGTREDEQRNVSIVGDSEEACEEAMKRVGVKHPVYPPGSFARTLLAFAAAATSLPRHGSHTLSAKTSQGEKLCQPPRTSGHLPSPCKHALGCLVVCAC